MVERSNLINRQAASKKLTNFIKTNNFEKLQTTQTNWQRWQWNSLEGY